MPSEIAFEVRIHNGITLGTAGESGIDGLHARIEADNNKAEVKAHTSTIGYSNLTPESIRMELPARLVIVVIYSPNVAGINKEGTVYLPEKVRTILDAAEKAHVPRLVDIVDCAVTSDVAAGTEAAQRPTAHIVSATGIVTFLEGGIRAFP